MFELTRAIRGNAPFRAIRAPLDARIRARMMLGVAREEVSIVDDFCAFVVTQSRVILKLGNPAER
jgi:hypothetical protein